jgi:hypothetical protein
MRWPHRSDRADGECRGAFARFTTCSRPRYALSDQTVGKFAVSSIMRSARTNAVLALLLLWAVGAVSVRETLFSEHIASDPPNAGRAVPQTFSGFPKCGAGEVGRTRDGKLCWSGPIKGRTFTAPPPAESANRDPARDKRDKTPQPPNIVWYLHYQTGNPLLGEGAEIPELKVITHPSLTDCQKDAQRDTSEIVSRDAVPVCSAIEEPDKLWLGNSIELEPGVLAAPVRAHQHWVLIYISDPIRGILARMSSWYGSEADCDNMRTEIAAQAGHDASRTACLALPPGLHLGGRPYTPPQKPRIVWFLQYASISSLRTFRGNHGGAGYGSLSACEDGMRNDHAFPQLHWLAPSCIAIVEPDSLWLGDYGPEHLTAEPGLSKHQIEWILIYRRPGMPRMGKSYFSKVDCKRAVKRDAARSITTAQPEACLAVPKGLDLPNARASER